MPASCWPSPMSMVPWSAAPAWSLPTSGRSRRVAARIAGPKGLELRASLGTRDAMTAILLVLHVLIAVAMVGVVLLQKSEGGGLGMGGGGMSGLMTGRSTANLLTRTTAILAGVFMLTSIALVILSTPTKTTRSFLDDGPGPAAPAAPGAPAQPAPAPAAPPAPVE